jgi:hypothetical protein
MKIRAGAFCMSVLAVQPPYEAYDSYPQSFVCFASFVCLFDSIRLFTVTV